LQFSAALDEARKLIVEYWPTARLRAATGAIGAVLRSCLAARPEHYRSGREVFFAMHNASFDAGIVAWHIKRKYDGVAAHHADPLWRAGQTVRAGVAGQADRKYPRRKNGCVQPWQQT